MNKLKLRKMLEEFLIEDIGNGDLSAELIFDEGKVGTGVFVAKSDGIVAGTDIISATYEAFGSEVNVKIFKNDGEKVTKGEYIAEVYGEVRTLLTCERVILNLMQRMSGIATMARKAVENLDDDSIRICDTRKTTPGLRMLEKYAVTCGGGYNHRIGLYDGVMLKDNHIAFSGSIENAVKKVKSQLGHMVKVEVETESAEQVKEAVKAGADVIMFDNRTPDEVRELVKLVPENIVTEISGGVTVDTIGSFRGTGVNYISLGALTHSVIPVDISFLSSEGDKL